MFGLGLAAVAALTLLAFAAALAVGVRARFAGRAELACAACVTWASLVLLPIYVLGFVNRLTAASLGVASAVVSLATLGIATRFRRDDLIATARAAAGVAMLPIDGLRVTWRAKSFAFVGLVFAGGMIAWTTLCTYWLPTWRGWDGPLYHEPIIGWTIQNHGFAIVDMPLRSGLQKVNGYPRLAEMLSLWFTIFTDRRLLDLGCCLGAPPMMLAAYAMTRRYAGDASTAIGFASGLMLMPAASQYLQSTYVDIAFTWTYLATAYFATRPVFRARDAYFTSLAAMLLIGCKSMGLVPGALFLAIALVRLVAQNRGRWRAIGGAVAFGLATTSAILAAIYLRNYVAFKNPFWPDMSLEVPKLHIHWEGINPPEGHGTGSSPFDMNEAWPQFFDDAFSKPYSWNRWHYAAIFDFTFAGPWVVWPLASIAMIVVVAALVASRLGRALNRPAWRAPADAANVAWLIAPIVIGVWMAPARWQPRYLLGETALAFAILAWVSARRGWSRLGEAVGAIVIVAGVVSNWWQPQRWWVWPSELATLMKIPYPEREVTPAASFDKGYITTGSCVTREAGLARENELGKGDVLAFPDNFGNFTALFWNDHFSNFVVWVPEGPDFVASAEKKNAKWVYVTFGDPNYGRLKAAGSGWQEVAPANVEHWGAFFRRVEH